VIARRELGDDATIGSVEVDLAVQFSGQDARHVVAIADDDRDARFIARGFDTQDMH